MDTHTSSTAMGYLVLTGSEHAVHAFEANQPVVVGGVALTAKLLPGPVLQLEQEKLTDNLITAALEAKLDHSLTVQFRAGELSMTSSYISELSGQIEQVNSHPFFWMLLGGLCSSLVCIRTLRVPNVSHRSLLRLLSFEATKSDSSVSCKASTSCWPM